MRAANKERRSPRRSGPRLDRAEPYQRHVAATTVPRHDLPLTPSGGAARRHSGRHHLRRAAALVDNPDAAEAEDLDYKQAHCTSEAKSREELAKDVAAFANHMGGVIIIGMAEHRGVPYGPSYRLKNRLAAIERDQESAA